ncbi:MAG: agmatinase family protein [Bacteroidales bacterium]|nr:agmatinase family protein [Bacteroidales bacterium]
MANFNADNNFLLSEGIFGLPNTYNDSALILIPVPWEVTCSYGDGTSAAPDAIQKASFQIDLFDVELKEEWRKGIFLLQAPESIYDANAVQRRNAIQIIHHHENDAKPLSERQLKLQEGINTACEEMNEYVASASAKIHSDGKLSGLVGGDHSVALEHIKAVAKREKEIGIIQIDAHADLRDSYMGFSYSHASLMFNLTKESQGIKKIVQIGLRDICKAESDFISSSPLFSAYFMKDIRKAQFDGDSLNTIFSKILNELPEKVYISFDIDGLDPALCPSTGTPVPGGFTYSEMIFLFQLLLKNKKKIVGFDLCETGFNENNDWDANVAARILYQLSLYALKSDE